MNVGKETGCNGLMYQRVNSWCLYVTMYVNDTPGEVFYVGKGTLGNRKTRCIHSRNVTQVLWNITHTKCSVRLFKDYQRCTELKAKGKIIKNKRKKRYIPFSPLVCSWYLEENHFSWAYLANTPLSLRKYINKLGLSCAKLRFSCIIQPSFNGRELNSVSWTLKPVELLSQLNPWTN